MALAVKNKRNKIIITVTWPCRYVYFPTRVLISLLIYNTCKFSQDFDLLISFIQIFCRISLAIFRLKLVLDPCNFWVSFFAVDFCCCLRSLDSRNRICFKIPTRSSSTLCWMPLDVSMNLQSRDTARAFPSVSKL